MERILTYIIENNSHGLRVEQFLRKKGFSRQNLTELKKLWGSTLINKTPCRQNECLNAKDVLTVYIRETVSSENIIPVELPLDIVYEDEDLLIVNKPAGMPIHTSRTNCCNTLANALAWYFEQQNKPFIYRCTNRLDRDTSGLTIIAKHMVSCSILSDMVHNNKISREYLGIVRGHLKPAFGKIDAPLSRKPGPVIERIVDYQNGESAVTHYRVLAEKNGHSLVSLQLETGRTHQIRIHMKHLGYPLVGDYLYNPDMECISRQALHSYRLRFTHPVTGKAMCFTAPLPKDMQRLGFPKQP